MSKKGVLIGVAIGITGVAVGYILGKHGTVPVSFLKTTVCKAYGLGVDSVLELISLNPDKKWSEEDTNDVWKRFVEEATMNIDFKTGVVTNIADEGALKMFTD